MPGNSVALRSFERRQAREHLARRNPVGTSHGDRLRSGRRLVGDATDRAIRRFDRGGKFRNNIGKDNPLNGLLIPNGVVISAWTPTASSTRPTRASIASSDTVPPENCSVHIGHFHGTDPAGFGGCCNPTNVAVGDRVYVTEKAGPRAKVYDFEGQLQAVIASQVFDPNCKNMSVAVDRRRPVYVADTVKLNIFVFEPVTV